MFILALICCIFGAYAVNRGSWGEICLTGVNGSTREADGGGGLCGGQMRPARVRVLSDGPVLVGRIQTELNGYASAPPETPLNLISVGAPVRGARIRI